MRRQQGLERAWHTTKIICSSGNLKQGVTAEQVYRDVAGPWLEEDQQTMSLDSPSDWAKFDELTKKDGSNA